VKNRSLDQDLLPSRLKQLVVDMFRLDILEPEKIADDEPLIGGSLGLDSFDAVELAICIEEAFGIVLCSRGASHSAFASIASLADFIHACAPTSRACPPSPAAARITRSVLASPSPGWEGRPAAVGP
jgi:acyl carrier protein